MTKQERDAWAAAYHLYDDLVGAVTESAIKGDQVAAREVFREAYDRLAATEASDKAAAILAGACWMLESIYRNTREC